jgi:uncharacterized protein (TIGR00369 family)
MKLRGHGHESIDSPFQRHAGVRHISSGNGCSTVRLPERPEVLDSFGMVSGAALYTLAEAAATACVQSLDLSRDVPTLLVTSGTSVAFMRPASGELTARAQLTQDPSQPHALLRRAGAVVLSVAVTIHDASGRIVAEMEAEWRATRRLGLNPADTRMVA